MHNIGFRRNRQDIPDATWGVLNETVFGSMMQCFRDGKVRDFDCKKTEIDFEIIMRHFDKERMVWVFGSLKLDLTPEFLTVLFHFPTEGEKIVPVTRLEDKNEQAINQPVPKLHGNNRTIPNKI